MIFKKVIKNEESDLMMELEMPQEWSDISIQQYFNIVDLIQNKDNMGDASFFVKMVSILSKADESKLMDYPISEFVSLQDTLNNFSADKIPTNCPDLVVIGDITFVPKKNMSNLTTNEMIWISNIEKNSKTKSDEILGKLTVLLRPGYQKVDEAGVTKWIQTVYNNDDFESRKKLFYDNLSVIDGIPLINFFLTGLRS